LVQDLFAKDNAIGVQLLPTPTVQQGRNLTSGRSNPNSQHHTGTTLQDVAFANLWGKYASAIERWQNATGRAAPSPTVDGKLSPAFVEWMMGYPEGWTADLPRTGALKALGNAIVPLQAATAWAHLLGMGEQEPQPEDDPVQWANKDRSSELSDFIAWIQEDK
jgi:DNA (cytosine-5)-methyltransferase 1